MADFIKPKEKRKIATDFTMTGKIPPQNIDMEEAVLGGMMLEKHAIEMVIDILDEDCFYKDANSKIFHTIRSLYEAAKPIDILTVTNQMKSDKTLDYVGGAFYIASLTSRVASAANIEYHARILREKYIQREMIGLAGEMATDAFDDGKDAFGLLDTAEQELYAIKNKSLKKGVDTIDKLITKAIKEIEARSSQDNNGLTGVGTGFRDLDKVTAGWQKSDLIILAARPSMGKTALALNMLRNAAVDFDKSVAFFSLEMSGVQLVTRLISSETGIKGENIRKAQLSEVEWDALGKKVNKLSEAKIFIDDTPQLSIFDLKAKCRRLHSQQGLDMVVIDYMQLMRAQDKNVGNREQEISMISRSLKGLAKELDIPIIALAQLSREVEKRADKKPMLSDLRESGSIEQDADIVCFLYRAAYYLIQNNEEKDMEDPNLSQILIRKHRNGSLGDVNLRFVKDFAKFENVGSEKIHTYMSKINIGDSFNPGGGFENVENKTDIGPSIEPPPPSAPLDDGDVPF